MRRKRATKRGRLLPLVAACGFGYIIGALHVATLRDVGHNSAAETVSLRFPKEWTAPAAITLAAVRSSPADADLFRPVSMLPPSQGQAPAEQPVMAKEEPAPAPERSLTTASLDTTTSAANGPNIAPRPAPRAVAKASGPAHAPAANRAGYILDDAQIASIKVRLHLTPDQQRMWPAVEAAHGAARNTQAAAVDPEAVEGLKSAAVPLIMSFNSEQKEEVRSLVHVMGLDQLATQF